MTDTTTSTTAPTTVADNSARQPAPRGLIAEDEPLLAAALQAELAALWPALDIVAVVGDGTSAVDRALALLPDVCFLDIRMPGASGLDAAQALAEDWPDGTPFPLLVFVTAYDQYAVQAFDAQAVDYIVKPVDTARLRACVTRLQARLQARLATGLQAVSATPLPASPTHSGQAAQPGNTAQPDVLQQTMAQLRALLSAVPSSATPGAGVGSGRLEVIQAQVGNLVHMVPVADVLYFEAADKYLRVVTASREHLIRMSLKDLLPQLDPQVFWQVHRGTVVQARCIATARRDESGKVFLSLRGRAEVLTASRLYAHLFKGM